MINFYEEASWSSFVFFIVVSIFVIFVTFLIAPFLKPEVVEGTTKTFFLLALLAIRFFLLKKLRIATDFISGFYDQGLVDNEMKRRAKTFYEKSVAEASLANKIALSTEEDPDQLQELDSLRIDCQYAKTFFWGGHALAKSLGFKVWSKYKDYLNIPEPKEETR